MLTNSPQNASFVGIPETLDSTNSKHFTPNLKCV